ncbi:MAG: cytochrome P450 [Paracoccaceae bacterium]
MGTPPPGPKGATLGKLNAKHWRRDKYGFLSTLAETFGDIAGFDIGHSPFILVNGAEHIRELLFKREGSMRKPEFVKDSNRGHWGDGLTTIDGPGWSPRRRILRPAFRASPVADRLPVVAKLAQEMLAKWRPDTDIDLTHELRLLTARIGARQVLNAELEGFGPGEGRSGILPVSMAYGEDFTSGPSRDEVSPLQMRRPRAPAAFTAVTKIVDRRIATGEDHGDILTELTCAQPNGAKLTREEVFGEVMQLLFAGHLTMPFCMVNFWRDLAENKHRAKLEVEAAHFCTVDKAATANIARSYCLATLKESMRLDPPAPILYREVDSPFELAGYEFARDTGVWVSPRLLHRDPRYYLQPECFRPERFLEQGQKNRRAGTFMPFGAGPRVCVASQQAFLQMTLICIQIASRFRLDPMAGASRRFKITALPD